MAVFNFECLLPSIFFVLFLKIVQNSTAYPLSVIESNTSSTFKDLYKAANSVYFRYSYVFFIFIDDI